jgi:hypothetical protein
VSSSPGLSDADSELQKSLSFYGEFGERSSLPLVIKGYLLYVAIGVAGLMLLCPKSPLEVSPEPNPEVPGSGRSENWGGGTHDGERSSYLIDKVRIMP